MNKKYLLIILLVFIFPLGCKWRNTLTNGMEEEQAFAKEFLTSLRNGDINDVKNMLDTRLLEKDAENNLMVFSKILNQSELLSEDLVGIRMLTTSGKQITNISFQYQFENSWAIANISIEKTGQKRKIMGITISPIPESLEKTNAFTFSGKSIWHYVIMLLAIINPIVIMTAFVICIMTNMKKHKWLWILFIVFGIGNFTLNWTTGQIWIYPVFAKLLGSGYSKMNQFAPLSINTSIPLGAILFLILRNKLKVAKPAKNEVEIAGTEDSQDTSGQITKD